jgi:hypothetical protein
MAIWKPDQCGPAVCVSEPFQCLRDKRRRPLRAIVTSRRDVTADSVDRHRADYRRGFHGHDTQACCARFVGCGWESDQRDRHESAAQGQHLLPLHPPAFAIAEQARTPLGHPPAFGFELPAQILRIAQAIFGHLTVPLGLTRTNALGSPRHFQRLRASLAGHGRLPPATSATPSATACHYRRPRR